MVKNASAMQGKMVMQSNAATWQYATTYQWQKPVWQLTSSGFTVLPHPTC